MNDLWQAITALAAISGLLTAGFVAAVTAIVRKETQKMMDWSDRRYARKEEVEGLKDALRCFYLSPRTGLRPQPPDGDII